jgi:NhaA family Na+:H+ antiporter
MSIFIALLSYKGHAEIQEEAKFAILIASAISGITGFVILKYFSGNGDFSYKKN